jgi:hypothetical protein
MSKRELGGDQQRAPFSAAEIDEGEVFVAEGSSERAGVSEEGELPRYAVPWRVERLCP